MEPNPLTQRESLAMSPSFRIRDLISTGASALLLLATLSAAHAQVSSETVHPEGCTSVLVGRLASEDGSTMTQ